MYSSVAITLLLCAGSTLAAPEPHHISGHPARNPDAPFKLCVPHKALQPCLKMIEQGHSISVNMQCVVARDRMECIEKVENHLADWAAFEPEDMYVAAKYANDYFGVFKEIRTKEEPDNEFRYEAVAVIHKDLDINNLHQLRGLKSCHTGIGRNVGFKIPITKLTKMGVLPPLNNTNMSPRENELSVLSKFFSKACLVGKWSPDEETNSRWKSQYSNLCALCEFPEKCDYPDVNSGYEGTLNCLSKAGGEVAWTKVIYVKKFFGMAYGSQPARTVDVNPNDYAYLCPDATKKPLTGPPCTWAGRPWPGYMANSEIIDVKDELKELRDEIKKLNDLGESSHAEWITTVLDLNNKTLAVDNGPFKPHEYLEKAKYNDVIERDVLKPARKIRLCVQHKEHQKKCELLSKAAFSRDIRPELECVMKTGDNECMDAINKKEIDVMVMDPGFLKDAEKYKLEPLASEMYKDNKLTQSLLIAIKKSSSINTIEGLKNKPVSLYTFGTALGYVAPVSAMLEKSAIEVNKCPKYEAFKSYFSTLSFTNDPLKRLLKGETDIAFIGSEDLMVAKENMQDLGEKIELLKPSSGRCDINNINDCVFATVPAQLVMVSKDIPQVIRDDALFTILSIGSTFSKRDEVFSLFGIYDEQPHVLFSDYAKGFVKYNNDPSNHDDPYKTFKKMLNSVTSC